MTDPPHASAPPTCPRHPDRVSYLVCQRCERPTCPDCQLPASVGFHCVDCVAAARAQTPVARTGMGGIATNGPPRATYTIIGLCVAAYLLQLLLPGFTEQWEFAPILGRDEPWRLLTAAFLHAPNQQMHILFNMLALWQVGQWLEPFLGRARFVALYLTSALGGSVGYLLLAQSNTVEWLTSMVGASGAVFGLFAALLVFLRFLGRSATGLLVLLVINALLPLFYPNIAWQAHLGGFLTGAVVAGALVALRDPRRRALQWPAVTAVVLLLVAAAATKYGTAELFVLR
ncbi:MAG TPA: rhomboid family intramembrane serine protease [Dermatophilaceae bacterium]|nr:rhomboid family intramembrane serine protease [Dermatophilaceae bacterium]